MNRRPGWIKLYNQTLESDFWCDPEPFSIRDAFVHVLLSANWREGVSRKNGHIVSIKRGQFLTSIRSLAETFHWDKKRVSRWLRLMQKHEMLKSESMKWGTLLTVVNYDKFQSAGDTHGDTHGDTERDTHGDTHGDSLAPRSKTIDNRQQTEDSQSPACAGTPSAESQEPPIGSPEWLELHYDD